MTNLIIKFNQEYDQFITAIALRMDSIDEVLNRKIGLVIADIFMICLIIFFLIRAL